MVATPIVELLTLFRSFFDEVRTGVTRFKVRSSVAKRGYKRDATGKIIITAKGQENTQSISQYGLTNQHVCLLQGVTLAPERRTGVLRSLGPMTQALLMVMEDKFFGKLRKALTHRKHTQKNYFPLTLFMRMWSERGNVQVSFSRAAMLKFYTKFCRDKKVTFLMRSGSDSLKSAEVIFHAKFGTYLDNLNILEQITDKPKWHNRKERTID